jgi:hypothetical protein
MCSMHRRRLLHGPVCAADLEDFDRKLQVSSWGQSDLYRHDSLTTVEHNVTVSYYKEQIVMDEPLLQGWALRPDDIEICTHKDGSEVQLGSGSYGTVRRSCSNDSWAVRVLQRHYDT